MEEREMEVVAGLEGIAAAESEVSFVDGVNGVLEYRGIPIAELAEKRIKLKGNWPQTHTDSHRPFVRANPPASPALCHEPFGRELRVERLRPNGVARDGEHACSDKNCHPAPQETNNLIKFNNIDSAW